MATPEQITIVVPTYNRRDSLGRCLRAILRCDRGRMGVTVLVCDDGSSDGTGSQIEALAADTPTGFTLRHLRQENAGQSAARNLGIQSSDTELILFTDDDCEPQAGWILGLAEVAGSDDRGFVGGRLVAAEQPNVVSRYCRWIGYNEYPPRAGDPGFANSANCAYRRAALERVGGYETLLPRLVDQDLGRRLRGCGYRLLIADEAVVTHHHREDTESLLRDYRRRGFTAVLRNLIWNEELPISEERLRDEWTKYRRRRLKQLASLPLAAIGLVQQGVEVRDAYRFAVLDHLRWREGALGKHQALAQALAGELPMDALQQAASRRISPSLTASGRPG